MFYIASAQRRWIMHCEGSKPEEKNSTREPAMAFRLPRHFASCILMNDHKHKGTFTSQRSSESALYVRARYVRVCIFSSDKWTALFSAAEFYLEWIPAGYWTSTLSRFPAGLCEFVCTFIPTLRLCICCPSPQVTHIAPRNIGRHLIVQITNNHDTFLIRWLSEWNKKQSKKHMI